MQITIIIVYQQSPVLQEKKNIFFPNYLILRLHWGKLSIQSKMT